MTAVNSASTARAGGAAGSSRPAALWHGRAQCRKGTDEAANGLSAFETRVLDLFDERRRPAQIAEQLAVPLKRVQRVINAYSDDGAHARACIAAKIGSSSLLRAQLRAGQHDLPRGVAQALIIALHVSPPNNGAER